MSKTTLRMVPVLAAVATILLVSARSRAVDDPAGPAVNSAAPGFTAQDTKGSTHRLADYRGRHVVLEWLNHGCPFVKKHCDSKNMQTLQETWTGKDVVWFSIISSAPGTQGHATSRQAEEDAASRGARPTAILLDGTGEVGRRYGARTTPHMFVIDPSGILIYKGAIDSIRSTDVGDIAKATNHVTVALEESLAGKPVSTPVTTPYGCSVKYRD